MNRCRHCPAQRLGIRSRDIPSAGRPIESSEGNPSLGKGLGGVFADQQFPQDQREETTGHL